MCHTLLVNFKTKFQLLPWQQLILPRLLTYHTTSERSPLSGQRAEHQISGESSRATYSQTMGHKLWDLWRRINKWFTGDRNAYILLQLTGVQFECASVKWKKNWEDVEGLCEGDVSKQQQTVTNVHAGRAWHIFETENDLWSKTPDEEAFFIMSWNSSNSLRLHMHMKMSTLIEVILAFCSTEIMNKMPTYHNSLTHRESPTSAELPLSN